MELAPRFADHNYRQCWAYGVFAAERIGAASEHVGVFRDGEVQALADVRIKRMPVVGGGVALISGGPLVRRGGDEGVGERLGTAMRMIKDEFVGRRGLVLRVVGALGEGAWNEEQSRILRESGFSQCDGPGSYRTLVVDIGPPAEQVRKNLAQKWRNCLNNAEKQGIDVAVGGDAESLGRFAEVFERFVGRKGFHVELGADFYQRVQAGLEGPERLVVQLAEREGDLVAGHISSMLGDTCVYLLGATTEAGLKCKAAYLLQWNTIRLAQARGLRWYDLGGIDPTVNPGVNHFKEGLGGADRSAPGPLEARPKGLRGLVTLSGERLYRRVRRVRGAKPAA